jgi:PLD-like domain
LLREAEKQIDMAAYVLTDSAVIEALRDASARGEKVRVWRDASGAACCSKRRDSLWLTVACERARRK